MVSGLKWLALAIIAAFQLTVLILVLRPSVSEAYRLHYITRTSGCFIKPAWRSLILSQKRPQRIDFAGMSPRTECVYLPDGWRRTNDAPAAIAKEVRATIMIPAGPASTKATLTLGAVEQDRRLRIAQGGRTLWEGVIAAGQRRELSLPLSARDADKDGLVRLDLSNIENNDDLNVALYALTID